MNLEFLKGRYGNQLFVLLIIALISSMIFSLLTYFYINYADGVTLQEMEKLEGISITSHYVSIVLTQLGTFLLPPLVFISLLKGDANKYLKLKKPKLRFLIIIIPLFISCFYIIHGLTYVNQLVPFSQEFIDNDNSSQELIEYMLQNRGALSVILNLAVFALFPAICEEFIFRGVIQKLVIKATKNTHLGVFLTAAFFAFVHSRYLTILPIFFMGIVLGYLFIYSKSIWTNIILHFINNAVGVILYIYFSDYATTAQLDYLPILLSIILFIGVFWRITKRKVDINSV